MLLTLSQIKFGNVLGGPDSFDLRNAIIQITHKKAERERDDETKTRLRHSHNCSVFVQEKSIARCKKIMRSQERQKKMMSLG